jgi:hypothetical protein
VTMNLAAPFNDQSVQLTMHEPLLATIETRPLYRPPLNIIGPCNGLADHEELTSSILGAPMGGFGCPTQPEKMACTADGVQLADGPRVVLTAPYSCGSDRLHSGRGAISDMALKPLRWN